MAGSLVEQHMEVAIQNAMQDAVHNAMRGAMGDNAAQLIQGIRKLASKQGGKTEIENYKLLGKRALVVAGVGIATVQVVSWVGGTLISRKLEAKRVEKIVRRILEEERQKEIDAKPEASATAGAVAVADGKTDGKTKND